MTAGPAGKQPGTLHVPPGLVLISFGYAHGAPPDAQLLFDVRPFRPRLPGLEHLTASHPEVERALRGDAFARDLVASAVLLILRYAWLGGSAVAAAGCDDGRQYAPEIISRLAQELGWEGYQATVYHRDISRPGTPAVTENPVTR